MTTEERSPPSGPPLRLELSSGLERELRIVKVIRQTATGTLAVVDVSRPGGAWIRGHLQLVPGSPQESRPGEPGAGAEVTTRPGWTELGAPRERRRAAHAPPALVPLSAVALLDSPALAPMLEFGALLDGGVYAISSLEQASTLLELVGQRGPTGPATACRFTAAVGRAVSLLHSQGLAHRGVGPAHVIVHRHGSGAPAVELTRLDLEAYSLPEAAEARAPQSSPTAQGLTDPGAPGETAAGAVTSAGDKAQDVDGLGRLLYMMLTGEPTLPLVHVADESFRPPSVDVAAVRRAVAEVLAAEQSGRAEQVVEVVLGAIGASTGSLRGSPWSAEDIVDRLDALYPSPPPAATPNGDVRSPSATEQAAPAGQHAPTSAGETSSRPAAKRRVLAEQLAVLVLGFALVLLGVVSYIHTNRPLPRPATATANAGSAAEESAGSLGDSDQVSPISVPGVVVGIGGESPDRAAIRGRPAARPSTARESPGARPPKSVARASEPAAPRTQPSAASSLAAPPPASGAASTPTTPPAPAPGTDRAGTERADLDVLVRDYAAAIESGRVETMAVLYPGMSSGERRSWERFFSLTSRRTARLDVRDRRQNGDSVLALVQGEIRYLNQSLGTTDRRPVSFLGVFVPTSGSLRMIAVRGAGTGG